MRRAPSSQPRTWWLVGGQLSITRCSLSSGHTQPSAGEQLGTAMTGLDGSRVAATTRSLARHPPGMSRAARHGRGLLLQEEADRHQRPQVCHSHPPGGCTPTPRFRPATEETSTAASLALQGSGRFGSTPGPGPPAGVSRAGGPAPPANRPRPCQATAGGGDR